MAGPKASVVIPSWNGAGFVARCLDRLAHAENVAEVVVVDHGRLNLETELAMVRFSSHPEFRYMGEDRQLGYAGAVNRGVSEASHDLIVVICNDVLVTKEWLSALLAAYAKEEAKGRSPVLFSFVEKSELPNPQVARTNFWFRAVHPEGAAPTTRFFHPDGSSFLFNRKTFGLPFDGDYFLYQEDVYLGWRAWLQGEEVLLVPASRVENFDGGTTRRTPYRTSFLTERNRWLNYFCFLSVPVLLRAMPLLFLDAAIKLAGGRNRQAKLHAWAWLLVHPRWCWRKRRALQAARRRPDGEILPLLSATYIEAGKGHPLNRLFRFLARLLGLPLGI